MELLAAGLGVDGDEDARVAAIFGVEGGGLHLELADGIEGDLGVLAVVGADVGVDAAIEIDVVHAAA